MNRTRISAILVCASSISAVMLGCKTTAHGSQTAAAGDSGSKARSAADVVEGATSNAALGQLSRYVSAWELPHPAATFPMEELLAANYDYQNPREKYTGRDGALKSISALPAGYQLLHRLSNWTGKLNTDGTLTASVSVVAQTLPTNASAMAFDMLFELTFAPPAGAPPLIQRFYQTTKGKATASQAAFTTDHVTNRGRASLLNWLYYFELQTNDPTPLRRMLDPATLRLNFGSGKEIGTYAELAKWYRESISPISQAYHELSNLSVIETSQGHYDLSVDLDWTAIAQDGTVQAGRQHQDWTLNDSGGQFALIQTIKVKPLVAAHAVRLD